MTLNVKGLLEPKKRKIGELIGYSQNMKGIFAPLPKVNERIFYFLLLLNLRDIE